MLEGFTLFHGNKGWQLSTKQAGVDGWSVRHIPEEHAQRILAEIDGMDYVPPPAKHKRRVLVLD
jgi:hypothetical protein